MQSLQMSSPSPSPPDGGWGWVVAIGAAVVQMQVATIAGTFGVYFSHITVTKWVKVSSEDQTYYKYLQDLACIFSVCSALCDGFYNVLFLSHFYCIGKGWWYIFSFLLPLFCFQFAALRHKTCCSDWRSTGLCVRSYLRYIWSFLLVLPFLFHLWRCRLWAYLGPGTLFYVLLSIWISPMLGQCDCTEVFCNQTWNCQWNFHVWWSFREHADAYIAKVRVG